MAHQQQPDGAHQHHGGVVGPEKHRAWYHLLVAEVLALRRRPRPAAHRRSAGSDGQTAPKSITVASLGSSITVLVFQLRAVEVLALRRRFWSAVLWRSAGSNSQTAPTSITVAEVGSSSTALSPTSPRLRS